MKKYILLFLLVVCLLYSCEKNEAFVETSPFSLVVNKFGNYISSFEYSDMKVKFLVKGDVVSTHTPDDNAKIFIPNMPVANYDIEINVDNYATEVFYSVANFGIDTTKESILFSCIKQVDDDFLIDTILVDDYRLEIKGELVQNGELDGMRRYYDSVNYQYNSMLIMGESPDVNLENKQYFELKSKYFEITTPTALELQYEIFDHEMQKLDTVYIRLYLSNWSMAPYTNAYTNKPVYSNLKNQGSDVYILSKEKLDYPVNGMSVKYKIDKYE